MSEFQLYADSDTIHSKERRVLIKMSEDVESVTGFETTKTIYESFYSHRQNEDSRSMANCHSVNRALLV